MSSAVRYIYIYIYIHMYIYMEHTPALMSPAFRYSVYLFLLVQKYKY